MLDRENTASEVWAVAADRSAKNEEHLTRHAFVSCIHRKKPKGRPMAERTRIANARKSKVRSAVEHVFAYQKGPMVLVVRTIGIARARVKIGLPISLTHAAVRLARPTKCARCSRLSAEVDNPKILPPRKTSSQSTVPLPPHWPIANNPFNQPSKPVLEVSNSCGGKTRARHHCESGLLGFTKSRQGTRVDQVDQKVVIVVRNVGRYGDR